MMRKKLIAMSSFLIMLSFASTTYANSCPGSDGCPINTTTVAFLKARGVTNTQMIMANKYLEGRAVKMTK
jgi:hypothetical protein